MVDSVAANKAPAKILDALLFLELTNTALALDWGNTICVRINGIGSTEGSQTPIC